MVSLATGSRGMSVKQQTLSVLLDLEFNQDRPVHVLHTKSHIRVKSCGLGNLRES